MTRVYVGVGSNIDRETSIREGINKLQSYFEEIIKSRVYESPAFGFEGGSFYNLVIGFDTKYSIDELTDLLHEIEGKFGRIRGEERFKSRTLDLDLLLYGDLVRHDEKYDIPREDIIQYAFVLCPLSEIAGNEYHPEIGKTYSSLWQDMDNKNQTLWPVDFSF